MTPIQNVPLDMAAADPRFAAQFIPSRHAPEPPHRRSPHSSNPSLPRVDSSLGHPVRHVPTTLVDDHHHHQAVKKANPHHGVSYIHIHMKPSSICLLMFLIVIEQQVRLWIP